MRTTYENKLNQNKNVQAISKLDLKMFAIILSEEKTIGCKLLSRSIVLQSKTKYGLTTFFVHYITNKKSWREKMKMDFRQSRIYCFVISLG